FELVVPRAFRMLPDLVNLSRAAVTVGIVLQAFLAGGWAAAADEANHVSTVPDSLERVVGPLRQDGPPTPEQIALHLPLEGNLTEPLRAEVRYRKDGAWVAAHPLFLIRPQYAVGGSNLRTAFAGTITGLEPGERYQVE